MKAVFYNTFDDIFLQQENSCQLLDIVSTAGKKTITLGDDSSLSYFLFVDGAWFDLDIILSWSHVSLKVYVLSYSSHTPITVRVHTHIQGNTIQLDKYFLSFVWEKGRANIDGDISVAPSAFAVEWKLFQEYVVLGKSISVSIIPWLSIYSKDVAVQHWCKIHTFDETSLFYLASKWLDAFHSKHLLLDGYFSKVSAEFNDSFTDYFASIRQKVLRFIF